MHGDLDIRTVERGAGSVTTKNEKNEKYVDVAITRSEERRERKP
jgi:hypothetical protein